MHLRNLLLALGVLALLAGVSLAVLWFTVRPSTTAAPTASASAGAGPARTLDKTILVAAHRIPAGTPLRDEDVEWKTVPAAEPGSDEILREPGKEQGSEGKYRGAFTHRDFAAGEPLLAATLIKPTDRGFLAAVLAPGARAVSIPVEAIQSMSALIVPANRVDVILTQTFGDDADPARKSVGETIIRDLRVIAVDQRLGTEISPTAGTTSAPSTTTPRMVTLEVTERQAEMLLVANRMGKVELAVRASGYTTSAHDEAPEIVQAIWASDVSPALNYVKHAPAAPATRAPSAGPGPSAGPAAAASPAQRAQKSTEVMHGSKLEAR